MQEVAYEPVPENLPVEANERVDFIRAVTGQLHVKATERYKAATSCFVVAHRHHEAVVLLLSMRCTQQALLLSGWLLTHTCEVFVYLRVRQIKKLKTL